MISEMRDSILAAATAIVQSQGYNGLSFRELAKQVGIKSASVHYYFPTKADLAVALVRRYRDEARASMQALKERSPDVASCLKSYTEGFRLALEDGNRMCLCGLLGAEYDELPEPVQVEVEAFVADNVAWLADILSSTADAPEAALKTRALAIYAGIAGAQLTARSRADAATYDTIVETYRLTGLIPA